MKDMNYIDGFRDGAEVFKRHMKSLLKMDSRNLELLFGDSSIANILNNHSTDTIMARMEDKRCIIAD